MDMGLLPFPHPLPVSEAVSRGEQQFNQPDTLPNTKCANPEMVMSERVCRQRKHLASLPRFTVVHYPSATEVQGICFCCAYDMWVTKLLLIAIRGGVGFFHSESDPRGAGAPLPFHLNAAAEQ